MTMRVTLVVATSIVDQRTRSAFSPACLVDIVAQLNAREMPVSYEYRSASIAGKTVVGTAKLDGADVVVDVDLSPPWWTEEELDRSLRIMGGGIAGRAMKEGHTDTVHVIDEIRVSQVALLMVHSSANPNRPAKKVTS